MSTAQIDELLQQARAAHRAGEDGVAESYFRRASEIAPDRAEVWLELSGVVRDLAEKRRCLERAAVLEPANEEVKAALAWVRRRESELIEQGDIPEGYVREDQIGRVSVRTQPNLEPPTGEPLANGSADEVPEEDEEIVYCARHPSVETTLRCNRCGTPICPKCAVRTPVGFRCPDCVRAQGSTFYNAGWLDYVLAAVVALALSAIAGFLAPMVGWFFMIFIGPAAGGLIGEIIFRATRRRRGRQLWLVVAAAMVVGAVLPYAMPALLAGNLRILMSPGWLLSVGLYLVLGVGAAIARLR
jgi:hypothetical protein